MALNPQLFPNGMPVPFVNELFVLARDGVEFHVDKIPGGGQVKTKGTIYLSNIRMVFVASKPVGEFVSFDMPLRLQIARTVMGKRDKVMGVWACDLILHISSCLLSTTILLIHKLIIVQLHIHGEKFNQPIFQCNNISGLVEPVVPDNEHRALYSTHSFKILFKEGGCGTFVPLFLNLITSVRRYNQQSNVGAEPRVDPLRAAETPVDEMMRHAYVDPNDPTRIFLQQPTSESQLRRRNYQAQPAEHPI